MHKIKLNILYNITITYIVGFLFIFYSPLPLVYNNIYILFLVACFYMAYKRISYSGFKDKSIFRYLVVISYIFLLYICYYIFYDAEKRLSIIVFIILSIPISYFLGYIVNRCKKNLISFFIILCNIQVIFVIITFLNPSIREYILNLSGSEALINLSNWNDTALRSFGYARSYTSTMPIFLGVFAAFLVFRTIDKYRTINLIYIILYIFSIFLNARVGIVAFVISLFILYLYRMNKFKNNIYVIVSIIFLVLLSSYMLSFNTIYSFSRIKDGMDEIYNLIILGKSTGTFKVLQNMIFIPNSLDDLLIGTGINVYMHADKTSDIGYVIDIFEIGIIGLFVNILSLFFLYIAIRKQYIEQTSYEYKALNNIIFSLLILFHFKGNVFASNELYNTQLILLFYLFFIKREIKLVS